MALTTGQLRDVWAPPCRITSRRVVLYGGAPVNVDYRTVEAFEALSHALEAHAYPADKSQTGAYNCRAITNGSSYSLHAYGIALDVNWRDNPYGPKLITNMPPALINDILGLQTRSGQPVFRWGGNYAGNKDAMHFEIVCTPQDLASGIIGHDPGPTKPDPIRPPVFTGGKMSELWEHPTDHRMEYTFINPETGALQTAWQLKENGGWVEGAATIDTPNVPANKWGPNTFAGTVKADKNFNWRAQNVDGHWYTGWYQEVATATTPVGWHGPVPG